MSQADFLVNVLSAIPILMVQLAGVVVAVILLSREDGTCIPAVLALIGFDLPLKYGDRGGG